MLQKSYEVKPRKLESRKLVNYGENGKNVF